MPDLGSIITAAVTPFDEDGRVDERAFVQLLGHLAATGSDGVVVAGTTGEASTLADDEHIALIELAAKEAPDGIKVIAGTGSNDTRHAVELTRAASEAGADAILSVTPYYNRPNRRGLIAHFEAVAGSTELPIILYNIPVRTGTDMPNDLLAELATIDNVVGVKQANNDNLAMVEGLQLYAGNDDVLARTLDLGGSGGILVASHIVGREMRRMIDEPENRSAINAELAPVFEALSVAPAAIATKAALEMIGILPSARVRLPYVEADASERATIKSMLEARGLIGVTTS